MGIKEFILRNLATCREEPEDDNILRSNKALQAIRTTNNSPKLGSNVQLYRLLLL